MRPAVFLTLVAGSAASAQFITSVLAPPPTALEAAQNGIVVSTAPRFRANKAAIVARQKREDDDDDDGDDSTTSKAIKKTKAVTSTTSSVTTTKEQSTTSSSSSTTTKQTSTSTTTTSSKTTLSHTTKETKTDSTTSSSSASSTTSAGTTSDTATSAIITSPPTDSATITSPSSTSTSTNATSTPSPSPSKGLSPGAAAGIAVGSFVAVALALIAVFFIWRRRQGGVRGAIVTADFPRPMSEDPFSGHGPQPTLPSLSGGASTASSFPVGAAAARSDSAVHRGYSSPGVSSPTGSTAYQGYGAAYAPPSTSSSSSAQRSNGYRALSHDDDAEGPSPLPKRYTSYHRLLPTEDVVSPPPSSRRQSSLPPLTSQQYQRVSAEDSDFASRSREDQHASLPGFMIPGGSARRSSLPVSPLGSSPPLPPVPTISLQAPTPLTAAAQPVGGYGRDKSHIPS